MRALALAGASVWAAPPWYAIVFVMVDSVRVMKLRHSASYAELVLTTLCAMFLTLLCGAASDWLSAFVGFCTSAFGVWSLPAAQSLFSEVKLTRGRVMVMPLALGTWALGSPFSEVVHYVGFVLVAIHTWFRDHSIPQYSGPQM